MRILKPFLTLLSAAGVAAFLVVSRRASVGSAVAAILLLFLASAAHMIAHETGHLIGGALSGYRLLFLQFGPLRVVRNPDGKLSMRWSSSRRGQCVMIPGQTEPVKYKAYNAGGLIANAVLSAAAVSLFFFASFYLRLFLLELACTGAQELLVNAIPHKTDSVPNDGYVLKLLGRNADVQRDYAAYLRLYGKLFCHEEMESTEFDYARPEAEDPDEMLYYNEIRDILRAAAEADGSEPQ